jgi:hypothetical protein
LRNLDQLDDHAILETNSLLKESIADINARLGLPVAVKTLWIPMMINGKPCLIPLSPQPSPDAVWLVLDKLGIELSMSCPSSGDDPRYQSLNEVMSLLVSKKLLVPQLPSDQWSRVSYDDLYSSSEAIMSCQSEHFEEIQSTCIHVDLLKRLLSMRCNDALDSSSVTNQFIHSSK